MKKYSFLYEFIISIILIFLVILFLDPFMIWIPSSMVYIIMVALIAFFVLFASLFGEKKRMMNVMNSIR